MPDMSKLIAQNPMINMMGQNQMMGQGCPQQ